MFIEFVAAIAAGFVGAGLALLAGKLSGGRLPKWLMPVCAGLGMIAYTIWSEYSWYDRTVAQLPDGLTVTMVNESKAIYRPWTYAVPFRNRFAAVDEMSIRTNDTVPDNRIADMYFYGRWSPLHRIEVMFDCAARRQAPLTTVSFAESGAVAKAMWQSAAPEDGAIEAACKEG